MERALVPVSREVWQTIQSIAPIAQASRMFGITEHQAAIVMLTGYELGLPMSAAFDLIYVSKDGRRTLRPKGALALLYASGELEVFDWESDEKSATVSMKRHGRPLKSMTLTIEQAKKAGWKSAAWDATPANLMRWRLIGWLADLLFTDILAGLSIADDSYMPVQITEDGDVIDAEVATVDMPSPDPSTGDVASAQVTIANILEAGFTAEQVMRANEGKIPATSGECERVLETLRGEVQDG